uniref:Integrase core domain-containing protein n=1 Tax=Larimichthys crocea TaxID=215358 RepID=A0A0F8AE44_LARCR
MHRVDSLGVVSRMSQLGCVVRRTYSVPCPKYLVHIDTNHKLIRYNIIIFGGTDGFSRKIMYLNAADNNRSDTNLAFFSEAVQEFGYPLRVRADHGGENLTLDLFRGGWDNHPLRTEQNMTPNQLWELGQIQHPIPDPEDLNIPEIDWEQSGDVSELHHGVNVPQFESPLSPEQLRLLKEHIDPLQPSQNNGVDIYLETLAYVENLVENQ